MIRIVSIALISLVAAALVKDEKGEVVELLYEQNEGVRDCKRIREATASKR